jgi:hypothetical protein
MHRGNGSLAPGRRLVAVNPLKSAGATLLGRLFIAGRESAGKVKWLVI